MRFGCAVTASVVLGILVLHPGVVLADHAQDELNNAIAQGKITRTPTLSPTATTTSTPTATSSATALATPTVTPTPTPEPCWLTDEEQNIVFDDNGNPVPCPPSDLAVEVEEVQAPTTGPPTDEATATPIPTEPQVIYITLPRSSPVIQIIREIQVVRETAGPTETPLLTPTATDVPTTPTAFPTPTSTSRPTSPPTATPPASVAPTNVPDNIPGDQVTVSEAPTSQWPNVPFYVTSIFRLILDSHILPSPDSPAFPSLIAINVFAKRQRTALGPIAMRLPALIKMVRAWPRRRGFKPPQSYVITNWWTLVFDPRNIWHVKHASQIIRSPKTKLPNYKWWTDFDLKIYTKDDEL